MIYDSRVFFMGHTGSIEAKYSTNKGKLPEAMLKEVYATLSQLLDNARISEELAKVQMLISELFSCKAKASASV